ncbi:glycosyltransferase family 2 protein [Lapillicoccus sp.]|uniref:glycosyltransferase family 2 protein n=1 Tax=Lapillicoccus sp. TaxID=1909287 RepID=UPI0025D05CC9|nr:glycosyltransferase family 2 protein [Lapillicoccus sp.]
MAVIAVVPAHDEAATIESAVASLRAQAVAFDRIVVVADNCTDQTVAIARAAGAEVFETRGNRHRKAGALNQALPHIALDDDDLLLVMDADTRLGTDYMAAVLRHFAVTSSHHGRQLGAVGGIFHGDEPHGVLQRLQAAEYARYAREIGRRQGRVHVLTGTASVFLVRALRDVATSRGHLLPGRRGDVYDTSALTEDNEITIALKTIGWGLVSPKECLVYTELMPTPGALHDQRLRWYRGAVDNIATYGLTRVTARYWMQQSALLFSTVMLLLYLVLMAYTIVVGVFALSWFWSFIGVIFAVERVVTVWEAGPRARFTAALIVPEMVYDVFLQMIFLRALGQRLSRSTPEWKHHTAPARRTLQVPTMKEV